MELINRIIKEQVDNIVNPMSKEQLLSLLESPDQILKALEKTQSYLVNHDNQITEENWTFFKTALKESLQNEKFQKLCRVTNAKLYAIRKFTDIEFTLTDNVEQILKFELKKYFPSLLTDNPDEFVDVLFSLPFEFYSLVVRYVVLKLYPDAKKDLAITREVADSFVEKLRVQRDDYIKNINKITQGENNTFNVFETQLLLDCKVFYEDSPINIAALEYIIRVLGNPNSLTELSDKFGKANILRMREQVLSHPCYIKFIKDVKKHKIDPYFDNAGLQNEEREVTFSEIIDKLFQPQDVIPKVKEKEQPKVEPMPPSPKPGGPETPVQRKEEVKPEPFGDETPTEETPVK